MKINSNYAAMNIAKGNNFNKVNTIKPAFKGEVIQEKSNADAKKSTSTWAKVAMGLMIVGTILTPAIKTLTKKGVQTPLDKKSYISGVSKIFDSMSLKKTIAPTLESKWVQAKDSASAQKLLNLDSINAKKNIDAANDFLRYKAQMSKK